MHEVLVNRLGGLSLPRKSVVRLTDRPDMTLDVYRGRKATMQHMTPEPISGFALSSVCHQTLTGGRRWITDVKVLEHLHDSIWGI